VNPTLIEQNDEPWLLLGLDTRFETDVKPTGMFLGLSGRIVIADTGSDLIASVASLDSDPDKLLRFPVVVSTYRSRQVDMWVCHMTHARRQRFGGAFDLLRFSGYDWAPASMVRGVGADAAEATRSYIRQIAGYNTGQSWQIVPLIVAAAEGDGRPGPRVLERALACFLKTGRVTDMTRRYSTKFTRPQ